MAKASNGDVIKLAAGTYSNVALKGLSFTTGVTITSADPLKPAVLTDLMITGSKGIKVQGLELANTKNVDLAFQVQGSSNIVLDNLNVHGAPNTAAAMNTRLMMIRSSSNVQVVNSEFSNGWHGISMLNNKQVRIEDNYFHDLRTDGVRGGGNSDLIIRANMFTNFHPQPADHPDAIQLWTANTSQSSSNILIDQNVVMRGTGTQIQGIFLRDITGSLPFNNVTVTHNLIEGARGNGIALNGVKGGTVANNVVQGFADAKSGIQMSNSSAVSVANNLSTLFFNALKPIVGTNGNTVIPSVTDNGVAMAATWLGQHSAFASAWKLVDPKALAAMFHLGGGGGVPAPLPTGAAKMAAALSLAATTDLDTGASDDTLLLTNAMQLSAGKGEAALVAADASVPVDHGDVGSIPDTGTGDTGGTADSALLPVDASPLQHGNVADDGVAPADFGDGSALDADDAGLVADTEVADDEADTEPANIIVAAPGVVDAAQGVDHIQVAVTGQHNKDDIIVRGFEAGVDKIVLADARVGAANQPAPTFHFIDTAAFTGTAGEVRYVDSKNGVAVMVDLDGDGFADLDFSLRDVHALSVSDFIL
ncbi:right-handed parallel beta-helix repeat-containing protein [Sphingobium sp. DEHP117]|uniref:right-handed parallel beta-helix repeat-containing protein n=1 Tax=Sphingobium sp. DEHP117 TaxID=2993436 RepID=UPI0027D74771|nr:right-handed parallel beta-helix repeat-containing protein [Sphingobium sp. DEHP117]MDQ4420929.1 right-handed parallel beta-helix repeat-containing protein [Sphingobium sp. DEHP117]